MYWAVIDDIDRLRGYGYERMARLFNDQLGIEDKRAWRGHAPKSSYPSVADEQ